MIPIFEPYLFGNEKKYITQCLDTNWVSSQGRFISLFEEAIASYHNSKYCLVTSSCTTALHLSLKSLNIGEGDEVICPALTFIAPANMIKLAGAKLELVDINPKTMTIDPSKIEEKITSKTKAILIVHQFGHAAHMDEILSISKKYNLRIIEDNAESLGGKYKDKILGSFGDISTLSFFGNKIITTGEGGALLTNDEQLANKARVLRDHGMSKELKYHHIDLGYNYRMTNMQAAIGLAQMEKLDEILEMRLEQMRIYYERLKEVDFIELRSFEDWTSPTHWLMTLCFNNNKSRDEIIMNMKEKGIECRPMINPVNDAEHFKDYFKNEKFSQSKKISKKYFHLPSSTGLRKKDIFKICNDLIEC